MNGFTLPCNAEFSGPCEFAIDKGVMLALSNEAVIQTALSRAGALTTRARTFMLRSIPRRRMGVMQKSMLVLKHELYLKNCRINLSRLCDFGAS